MIIDHSPAEKAVADFRKALRKLSPADRSTQRRKFLAMFEEGLGRAFFIRMELAPTGPTHNIERSTLHPSEWFLSWIAAISAGNVHWDVER